jgi:hypothetical protein
MGGTLEAQVTAVAVVVVVGDWVELEVVGTEALVVVGQREESGEAEREDS